MEFLKSLSLKVKLFFATLASVLGTVLFFFVKSKIGAKEKMEFELEKVKKEIEIASLEEKEEEHVQNLNELKEKEVKIREKIKYIEEQEEVGHTVSLEELDKFFDDRGL